MSSAILLALAAGGGLAYLLKKRSAAVNPNPENGIQAGVGFPAQTIQGKSGRPWAAQIIKCVTPQGGGACVESETQVIALPLATEPFKPHMALVFSQKGDDKSSRKFVLSGPTTAGLLQAAMTDFGVGPRA